MRHAPWPSRDDTERAVLETAVTAVTWVFALLLAAAGARKVTTPAATSAALHTAHLPSNQGLVRVLGAGEVVLGGTVLLLGGRLPAAGLALAYAAFALFARRQARSGADCGCFGAASAPTTSLHVAVNIAGAAISAVAAVRPGGSLPETVLDPGTGMVIVALVATGAALLQLTLTALPDLAAARALVTETDA